MTAAVELAALELFAEAIELDPAQRTGWLADRCGEDTVLLARVLQLIAADESNLSQFMAAGATRGHFAPAGGMLPPPRVGPYALEELIGAGGMGSVYRARRDDGLFDQTVAVKFIRPMRGDFQIEPLVDAERRLLARMEHPAIARILDGGMTGNGLHFLVMEFISGEPLDDYVRRHALDVRARLGLMREICAAVAHAHQHLVLHCDLKPANVLVTKEGRPKLIDFGVARIQDVIDAALPEGYTRAYTSPQRLAGAHAAVADDVYSLGIILHEILAGVLPDDPQAGALPPELAAVIAKATAFEREQRYVGAMALEADLAAFLELRPLVAMGDHWRYRARKLVQRRPWRVAAASAALLGLVTALLVTLSLYRRAEAARSEAEQRFSEVRSLANYMLFDLDSRLETTPGNTQARREMVGRSQKYLDALAATAGSNRDLQREAAVGLARLAEVQGVPGRAHVGEPAAAKANLERAESMLVKLAALEPTRMDRQRDLGRTRYLLALVYGGIDNNPARQLVKAREAEASLQTALDGAPNWRPSLRDLAELHTLLTGARLTQADALKDREDYAGAARIQLAEEQRLLELPPATQQAMEFDYQSGRPAMLLGDSLYYLGRLDDALAAYRRATARFEQGLQKTPQHRRLLEGAAIGYWNMAGTLDELKRPREALAEVDKATPIVERVVALDPQNIEAWRLRATIVGEHALLLAELGHRREAIAITEAGLREREQRAAKGETSDETAESERDLAVPLRNLARLYEQEGDRTNACRVLRRAVAAWEAIDRRWGLTERDRRNELEVVRGQLVPCGR